MRHKVAFSISWWNHGFFRNVEIMKINGLTSLALIGGETSRNLLDRQSTPLSPPCVGTSQPCRFLSETFATYDRARRGRPPEANDKKLLNIIGFDRWKDFAQPARPPIHPTFTPCVGTSQPCRFLSETFATYDRARRGRPPEANDKKLLNIIGFDR